MIQYENLRYSTKENHFSSVKVSDQIVSQQIELNTHLFWLPNNLSFGSTYSTANTKDQFLALVAIVHNGRAKAITLAIPWSAELSPKHSLWPMPHWLTGWLKQQVNRPFSHVGHLDIETRLITHEIQDGGQHALDACCAWKFFYRFLVLIAWPASKNRHEGCGGVR